MSHNVTRLLPAPTMELPLEGLYLAERLDRVTAPGRALIYTNFLSSLDGRISVGPDGGRPSGVPEVLANDRDWRLYQELAYQADVLVTSGRYVREYAAGEARPILTPETVPDLEEWRKDSGRTRRPALAVVSRQLDFDEVAAGELADVVIGLGSGSVPGDRMAALEARGIAVIRGGSAEGISGREIAEGLAGLGYRNAYSAAGPQLAHLFIADGVLDRLYLTLVTNLLAGSAYVTLDEGRLLGAPNRMTPSAIYLDAAGAGGTDQLFMVFRPAG